MFFKPLDRRGIIEAIRGPSRPGRLERQYRLAIEDGLPEVIADNLLANAGSALAPTLQVLLTKLWERVRQANPDDLLNFFGQTTVGYIDWSTTITQSGTITLPPPGS